MVNAGWRPVQQLFTTTVAEMSLSVKLLAMHENDVNLSIADILGEAGISLLLQYAFGHNFKYYCKRLGNSTSFPF